MLKDSFFSDSQLSDRVNSYISNVSQRRDRIDSGDHAARSRFMLRELLNSHKKKDRRPITLSVRRSELKTKRVNISSER